MDKKFTYITAKEFDNYTYIKAPKELVYSPQYRTLSGDARFLYIAMLDRLSLSIRTKRTDDEGRVYIIMSHKDIKNILGCSSNKATRLLAELDVKGGAGLISKKRCGLGHPDIIYINSYFFENANFKPDKTKQPVSDEPKKSPLEERIQTLTEKCTQTLTNENDHTPPNENNNPTQSQNPDSDKTDEKTDIPSPGKAEETDNQTTKYKLKETAQSQKDEMCSIKNAFSGIVKNEIHNSPNLTPNKNKYNKNKYFKTEFNNQSYPIGYDDWIDDRNQTTKFFKDVIGYEALLKECNSGIINNIVAVLTEACCTSKPYLKIGGEYIPSQYVRRKLLSVDYSHIEYVYEGLMRTSTEILNMRAYLLTSLYNSIDILHTATAV